MGQALALGGAGDSRGYRWISRRFPGLGNLILASSSFVPSTNHRLPTDIVLTLGPRLRRKGLFIMVAARSHKKPWGISHDGAFRGNPTSLAVVSLPG